METRQVTLSKIMLLISAFIIVALIIYAGYGTRFYNSRNITSMAFQMGEFAFLCMAMALAMLTGGIDLSVVANMNLAGILAAYVLVNENLLETLGPWPVVFIAVLVAVTSGTLGGLFNGVIVAKLGVHSVLTTIGTMMLFGGFGLILTGGSGVVGFPNEFAVIGNERILGIPVPFVLMLVAFLIVGTLLRTSRWGRSLYLMGSNPIAARFSGIKNHRTTITTFAAGGFLVGISALIIISRSNSARVGFGEAYLLQAVLVAVMGTMDPHGGSGRFSGILISVMMLQIMSSAFTRLGITPFARGLVNGSILLLIMVAYHVLAGKTIRIPSLRKRQPAEE
jgi:simple sugar transport system permease protein